MLYEPDYKKMSQDLRKENDKLDASLTYLKRKLDETKLEKLDLETEIESLEQQLIDIHILYQEIYA